MFDLDLIRRKQFYHTYLYDEDFFLSWDDYIKYVDNKQLPDKSVKINKHGRVIITDLEKHQYPNIPNSVEYVYDLLKQTFHRNHITIHIFSGIRHNSGSLPPHKDGMDVLYVHGSGSITMNVLDGDKPDSKKLFSEKFENRDCLWIPRGTYHLIQTHGPRIGWSFGIEGKVDPVEYI